MAELLSIIDQVCDSESDGYDSSDDDSDDCTDITPSRPDTGTSQAADKFQLTPSRNLSSSWTQASSADDCSQSRTSGSSTPLSGILSLRRPTAAEISRKRKIASNHPPKGKKRSTGPGRSDPKSVTPYQRVKKFPNEAFTVSNGKLFCLACREELSIKSSIINNHIKSIKHGSGKKLLETKNIKDADIVQALKLYEEAENPRGGSLPDAQRVYRVKVAPTFLTAGVPLNKLPLFRELLEENGYRLTDRRYLSDLIPFILAQEKEELKCIIKGRPISVIFDGTTRVGEVFVIVVRYVNELWNIQQKLIRLHVLANSMSGEQIAREVVNALSVEYSIQSQQVLAMMYDCASTNLVALRTLSVLYPTMLGIGCFSHTLNRVGERFNVPVLNEFVMYWISLFSHSTKAKFLWKKRTGFSIDSYCPTRWWSRWEVMNQLLTVFGDVEPFLNLPEEFSEKTKGKLLTFLTDPKKRNTLNVELASVVDAGKPLVEATYNLESDELVVFKCYDLISSLSVSMKMENYPNIQAVVRSIVGASKTADTQLKWMKHARDCIKPAADYFNEHIKAEIMSVPLKAFKTARMFDPHHMKKVKPEGASLNSLSCIPFLTTSILDELQNEFPKYVALIDEISPEYTTLEFWRDNAVALPKWSESARMVMLLQPSSAAAERVFSLLNNSFGSQQLSSLEDYLEISLMLQHNRS